MRCNYIIIASFSYVFILFRKLHELSWPKHVPEHIKEEYSSISKYVSIITLLNTKYFKVIAKYYS